MQKNLNNLNANTTSNADMSQSGLESKSQNITHKQTAKQENSIMPKYKTGDDIGPILTYLRTRIKMEQRQARKPKVFQRLLQEHVKEQSIDQRSESNSPLAKSNVNSFQAGFSQAVHSVGGDQEKDSVPQYYVTA